MKSKALFLAIPLSLGLVACGGGGSTATSSGFVSVMVTDAMSTQYTKVWVTLTKATVKDSSGTVIELFNDPAGQVFNLTELNGVSNLLSTQSLAGGTYSDLTITLDQTVTLNTRTATTTAALASTEIPVAGSFTVSGGATSVGIDFDLANFTYTPPVAPATVGTVTPALVLRDHNAMQTLGQAYAEVEGTIKSVASNNQTDFVMTLSNGTDVTVSLASNATVWLQRSGVSGRPQVTTDNELLRGTSIGSPVEVYGNYDSTNLTIEAVRVRVANNTTDGHSFYGKDRIEGLATMATNTLTIDVREASFSPNQNQLSMSVDTNTVKVERGSLADIRNATSGVQVEIRGNWDSTTNTFVPLLISVEGAQPDPSSNGNSTTNADIADQFIELTGKVNTAYDSSTQTFTLDVIGIPEHLDSSATASLNTTAPVSINLSRARAWFKLGNSGCLAADAFVEVKGALTVTGEIDARVIRVESACSFSGNPVIDNHGLGQHPDVAGAISTVNTNNSTLTLTVFRAKGLTGIQVGDLITVDYSQSPLFDRGTSANLVANQLIEVNAAAAADWTAAASGTPSADPQGTLIAAKIKLR